MTAFLETLDRRAPELLGELKLPGVALAVIERHAVAAIRTYGLADLASGRALAPGTKFRLASVSKSVAAWGVMKLAEAGRVDLDEPIARYLTRWHLPESGFDHAHITPRRILSHIAGLSPGGCDGFDPMVPLPSHEDCLSGNRPVPLDAHQLRYFSKVGIDPVKQQAGLSVIGQPGAAFEYSNSGYSLLQLLIEEISGERFADYMTRAVLEPLGMHQTTFANIAHKDPIFATAYDGDLVPVPLYRYVLKAAGGLSATIGDLATFTCAGMSGPNGEPPGRSVLSPESVREMYTAPMYAESEMGLDFFTGLGHFVTRSGGYRTVHHTGGFIGWRSIMALLPEVGAGIAVLVNSSDGNPLWQTLVEEWADSL